MAIDIELCVHRNPYDGMIDDDHLAQLLAIACADGYKLFEQWSDVGKIEPGKAYGFVMLDPTTGSWDGEPKDRVLAQVWLGPKLHAQDCAANGLAKAIMSERAGVPNGALMGSGMARLRAGEFAWGGGVCYRETLVDQTTGWVYENVPLAWGGGSGLTAAQDAELGKVFIDSWYRAITHEINSWLAAQRKANNGRWGWLNPSNMPPQLYFGVHQLPVLGEQA